MKLSNMLVLALSLGTVSAHAMTFEVYAESYKEKPYIESFKENEAKDGFVVSQNTVKEGHKIYKVSYCMEETSTVTWHEVKSAGFTYMMPEVNTARKEVNCDIYTHNKPISKTETDLKSD